MQLGRVLALTRTKDSERMWRASKVVIDYDFSIANHLDRCKTNKRKLASVIGTFNLAEITLVRTDGGRFRLDEADMIIVLV